MGGATPGAPPLFGPGPTPGPPTTPAPTAAVALAAGACSAPQAPRGSADDPQARRFGGDGRRRRDTTEEEARDDYSAREAARVGGFGAELASQIQEHAFDYLDAPVLRVAGSHSPIPFSEPLEKGAIPDPDQIAAAIRESLQGSK